MTGGEFVIISQQMKNTKETTDYCCPLCDSPLIASSGDSMSKDNGWTLYCPNLKCPAQEVSGHGSGRSKETAIANAYKIIRMKFTDAKVETLDDEETE